MKYKLLPKNSQGGFDEYECEGFPFRIDEFVKAVMLPRAYTAYWGTIEGWSSNIEFNGFGGYCGRMEYRYDKHDAIPANWKYATIKSVKAMGAGAYRDYLIELEWADDVREHIFDGR